MSRNNQEWKNYTDQLNADNQEVFADIKKYIDCSDNMYDHKDQCLEEVVDLLISAQMDGVSAERVIGTDHEAFSNNILQSVNESNRAQRIVLRILAWALALLAVSMLEILISLWKQPASGGSVFIWEPFLFMTCIVGLDSIVEVIIRKMVVLKKNDFLYRHRTAVKVLTFIAAGLVSDFIQAQTADYMVNISWMYLRVSQLWLLGAAIILFAVVFFVVLGNNKKENEKGNRKEERMRLVIANLEKRYQKELRKKNNAKQEENVLRESFKMRYIKEYRMLHYMFLIELTALMALLFVAIQTGGMPIGFIIGILVLIGISGVGFGMEKSQRQCIERWRNQYR